MGQFSMTISAVAGSVLGDNQHTNDMARFYSEHFSKGSRIVLGCEYGRKTTSSFRMTLYGRSGSLNALIHCWKKISHTGIGSAL